MKAESAIWVVCVVSLFGASCTYESTSLGDVLCDSAGQVEAGRRCVDGVWVAVDMSSEPEDMPDPLDMPPRDMPAPDMPDDMPCQPEADSVLCMNAGLDCDAVTLMDRCGVSRPVDCGTCAGGKECGSFAPNKCECPCNINSECFNPGEENPDNECEVCDPSKDRDEWTPKGSDASCDDGLFCSVGDRCDGQGLCVGAARDCSSADTACEVGSCDEMSGRCEPMPKAPGTSCALSGQVPSCVTGECNGTGTCAPKIDPSSCLIGGVCYEAMDRNPSNSCQRCVPTSPTAWDDLGDGVTCGDATACGQRRCNDQVQCVIVRTMGCVISNACVAEGAQRPNQFCEVCDSSASSTVWSIAPGTCKINGVCVASGVRNPNNPCQECNPQIPTQWSNVSNGTMCMADNKACTRDVCQNGSCDHVVASIGENCLPLAGDTCAGAGSMCRCDNAGICVDR